MDYKSDSKIWRVGCPLFAYFFIRLIVEAGFYTWLWYKQFKEINLTASLNGIGYVEEFGNNIDRYALIMAGVAMLITIPVMYFMIKKDYEYPVNRRTKERKFYLKKYIRVTEYNKLILPILAGVAAASGFGRLIMMLPIDGILGDYSQIQVNNSQNPVMLQLLILGIISPVVEELLFRGLVYNRLKNYYDETIAAYIGSIIFAVAHLNLVQGLYGFVMGIIFCFIYEKYKNIVIPMVMHMMANITAVLMSVNPISKFVDAHWFIRLPVAVIFMCILGILILKIYRDKNVEEKDITSH